MPETTPPPEPPAADSAPSTHNANRFFTWMRSLGIVRGNGWIGGVCGGIAARLGIDPLIVRGIAIVVAILGGPIVLLYAAAWLLLPDGFDQIQLEKLIAGRFEPAMVGIGVLALLAFLPVSQGLWWAGSPFWGDGFWPAAVGRTLWTLVVVGLIVAFVIWAARSSHWSSRGGAPDARTASAHPPAPGYAAAAAEPATRPAGAGPAAPEPRPSSGDPDALEEWKRHQEAWKAEHDAWLRRQSDEQQIRAQRSAEMRAQATAMAAQADEARRLRKLANPRTSGAYIGIAVGITIVAGAIAGAVASGTSAVAPYAVPVGFAVATLIMGLSIMLAGVLRRRSGFLTFLSIVLVVCSIATAVVPRGRDLVLGYGSHVGVSDARVFVPVGAYTVFLSEDDVNEASAKTKVIDIEQGIGGAQVVIDRGLTVRVVATQELNQGSMSATTLTDDGSHSDDPAHVRLGNDGMRTSVTYGAASSPDVVVRITQWVGAVDVQYNDARSGADDQTRPSPSPAITSAP